MAAEAQEIHLGDIGTLLKVTIKDGAAPGVIVNLGGATTKEIKLKPPKGGTTKVKTAAFFTDGSDGIITFTSTVADDFDVHGKWKIQGHVIIAGADFHSAVDTFEVHRNL